MVEEVKDIQRLTQFTLSKHADFFQEVRLRDKRGKAQQKAKENQNGVGDSINKFHALAEYLLELRQAFEGELLSHLSCSLFNGTAVRDNDRDIMV